MVKLPPRSSWFADISDHLPELVVLVLDGCKWVDTHCAMALSKCEKLEALCLRDCYGFGNGFSYISLASRCETLRFSAQQVFFFRFILTIFPKRGVSCVLGL
jgi:hypothetical protein